MPDAPVQIIPDSSGSAPAAPVQVTANGSASSPAAPPDAAAAASQVTNGVVVAGTLTPAAAGFLARVGTSSSKPLYANANTGSIFVPPTGLHKRVVYQGGRWTLEYYANGSTGGLTGSWQANAGSEATPDLASGWAPVSGGPSETGTPTLTLVTKAAPPTQVQPGAEADGSQPAAVLVSGSLTPAGMTGLLVRAGTLNGRNRYASDGIGASGSTVTRLQWSGSQWALQRYIGGVFQGAFNAATDTYDPTDVPGDSGSELTWTVQAGAVTPTGSPVLDRAHAPPPQTVADAASSAPAAPPAIV